MTRVVLLDCGPLGLLTNPNQTGDILRCRDWATDLKRKGSLVMVPEICDYEHRRKLMHLHSGQSLAQLDELISVFGYLAICTDAMRKAAENWASVRILGVQTAGNERLDVDMILCAQAFVVAKGGDDVWIATGNVGHLALCWPQSRLWYDIKA